MCCRENIMYCGLCGRGEVFNTDARRYDTRRYFKAGWTGLYPIIKVLRYENGLLRSPIMGYYWEPGIIEVNVKVPHWGWFAPEQRWIGKGIHCFMSYMAAKDYFSGVEWTRHTNGINFGSDLVMVDMHTEPQDVIGVSANSSLVTRKLLFEKDEYERAMEVYNTV